MFLSVAVVSTQDCGTQLRSQKTRHRWSKTTAATELTGPAVLKPPTIRKCNGRMCLRTCRSLFLLHLRLYTATFLPYPPVIIPVDIAEVLNSAGRTSPLISDLPLVLGLLLCRVYARHVHKYTDHRAPCHYSQSLLRWVCSCVYGMLLYFNTTLLFASLSLSPSSSHLLLITQRREQ